MMKSFFKKLAFVMALAMVVSMAAPAGAAYAAEVGLSIQGEKTARETFYIEVDDTVDLGYVGYEGWTKDTPTNWVSDDTTVAVVDGKGNVTGIDNGEATITLTVGTNGWTASAKVIVGTGKAEAETPATSGDFEVVMLSDHSVRIYTTLDVTATQLAEGLQYWYYEEGLKIEVELVQSVVKDEDHDCFVAKMYDGVLFVDGVTYGFGYGESFDEFDCVIGDVTTAALTLDGEFKNQVVINDEDDEDGYVLGAVMYDEYGTDITATAMDNGVFPVFDVSVDEDERYTTIDLDGGVGLVFDAKAVAVVKVSCLLADEELEEDVVLVDSIMHAVEGIPADPYKIYVENAPEFTMTETPLTADFIDTVNHKIAVGDEGYSLVIKLKDNKEGVFATNGYYFNEQGTIDLENQYVEGTFTFKSTNVGRLYVTNEGVLMPNAAGKASVLVYFTPEATDENENPKAVLASVVTLNVDPARKTGKVTVAADKTTLSTKNVNNANKTTVTVTVADSLGDIAGVEGKTVTIEPTIQTGDLKNAFRYPEINATSGTVNAEGKVQFTITATDGVMRAANSSQKFEYEIKVGGEKKAEFELTVKSPNTGAPAGTTLIFGEAKEIKDGEDVARIVLPVSLAGVSNKVASTLLPIKGKKVNASEADPGCYYYTVFKNGTDITDKNTVAVDPETGILYIDITNEKNFTYKEYTGAATSGEAYVDLLHGDGTYKVVVYKYISGRTYSSTKTSGSYTVNNLLPSVDVNVTKVYPSYAITDNIGEIVKNCFKFKIRTENGTVEFDEVGDYTGYHISIDANTVAQGEVVFINSVTFYKESLDREGVWIKCGTVKVNDYVTLETDN